MKSNYLNIQFTHAFAAPPCAREDRSASPSLAEGGMAALRKSPKRPRSAAATGASSFAARPQRRKSYECRSTNYRPKKPSRGSPRPRRDARSRWTTRQCRGPRARRAGLRFRPAPAAGAPHRCAGRCGARSPTCSMTSRSTRHLPRSASGRRRAAGGAGCLRLRERDNKGSYSSC